MDGAMIPIIAVLGGMMIGGAGLFGWIHTTRLKIKHGYPLETMWGVPIHPSSSEESKERLKLLTQENAQLRAELGAIKDRLGNVERIVTDSGYSRTHESESLRERKDAH